jgi:hypothetical protein
MTPLTPTIRPAAAFHATSRFSAVRGLVVFCVSAIIAASFVFDVASGWRAQPKIQAVQQASFLS